VTRTEGPEVEIRRAAPTDAAAVAELWAVCQPDSIWARLGPRVAEVHFMSFCQGGRELGVVAWLGDVLAGACLGTDRPASFGRALYMEHSVELASALAREIVSRPVVALVLLRRVLGGILVRLRSRAGTAQRPADVLARLPIAPDHACYMSDFFVRPSARGRRLGTLMLCRFIEEMAARGRTSCIVHTTVDNVASQVAQRRAGFECVLRRESDLTFLRRIDT
jgi:ribosomal protein S18 acetylase RimI-like enzyme